MSQLRIQDARVVAFRALSLGALIKRAEWEITVQNADDLHISEEARQHVLRSHYRLNERLLLWLQDEKILPHCSPSEYQLLYSLSLFRRRRQRPTEPRAFFIRRPAPLSFTRRRQVLPGSWVTSMCVRPALRPRRNLRPMAIRDFGAAGT